MEGYRSGARRCPGVPSHDVESGRFRRRVDSRLPGRARRGGPLPVWYVVVVAGGTIADGDVGGVRGALPHGPTVGGLVSTWWSAPGPGAAYGRGRPDALSGAGRRRAGCPGGGE